jgi:hypothetical protein
MNTAGKQAGPAIQSCRCHHSSLRHLRAPREIFRLR